MNNISAVAIVLAAIGYLIGRVGKSNENPFVKRIEEVLYAISLLTFGVSVFAQPPADLSTGRQLEAYLNDQGRVASNNPEYIVRVSFDNTLVVAQLVDYWQGDDDAQKRCDDLVAEISHAPANGLVENIWIVSSMAQNEENVFVCQGSR